MQNMFRTKFWFAQSLFEKNNREKIIFDFCPLDNVNFRKRTPRCGRLLGVPSFFKMCATLRPSARFWVECHAVAVCTFFEKNVCQAAAVCSCALCTTLRPFGHFPKPPADGVRHRRIGAGAEHTRRIESSKNVCHAAAVCSVFRVSKKNGVPRCDRLHVFGPIAGSVGAG